MATDILNITEVLTGQSQKEVTFNQAVNDLALAGNDFREIAIEDGVQAEITSVDDVDENNRYIFDRNFFFDLINGGAAPAGAFTVNLPATRRLFCIRNNTAQEATIQVDPGNDGPDGAVVAIAAGENSTLYSTGTDVISIGGGGGGLDLDFSGQAGNFLRGNVAEDNVEFVTVPVVLSLAVSDETNVIAAGGDKVKFRMPHALEITEIRASLSTASSVGTVEVDINEGGATILSTKLTIDAGETTSVTAATPVVISDTTLADNAEISIDIDNAGTSADAIGLKVYIIGRIP